MCFDRGAFLLLSPNINKPSHPIFIPFKRLTKFVPCRTATPIRELNSEIVSRSGMQINDF